MTPPALTALTLPTRRILALTQITSVPRVTPREPEVLALDNMVTPPATILLVA